MLMKKKKRKESQKKSPVVGRETTGSDRFNRRTETGRLRAAIRLRETQMGRLQRGRFSLLCPTLPESKGSTLTRSPPLQEP